MTNPTALETLAIREALELARDLSLLHVIIASDCKDVFTHIQKDTGGMYANIVKEILVTSRQFTSCSFISKGQDTNIEAHSLTKHF